jgi:hypothetical protein
MLAILIPFVAVWLAVPRTLKALQSTDKSNQRERNGAFGFVAVVTIVTLVLLGATTYDTIRERWAFNNKKYHVVEGIVQNYSGSPDSPERTISFDVRNVRFEVSCCRASMRLQQFPLLPGPGIRNGELLRIMYLSPQEILLIEKPQVGT